MPLEPDAGVPDSVAVPFPLSTNVTPGGSAPDDMNVGTGNPDAMTVKLPGDPLVNATEAALVIDGG
jgi:hypothetical protein